MSEKDGNRGKGTRPDKTEGGARAHGRVGQGRRVGWRGALHPDRLRGARPNDPCVTPPASPGSAWTADCTRWSHKRILLWPAPDTQVRPLGSEKQKLKGSPHSWMVFLPDVSCGSTSHISRELCFPGLTMDFVNLLPWTRLLSSQRSWSQSLFSRVSQDPLPDSENTDPTLPGRVYA